MSRSLSFRGPLTQNAHWHSLSRFGCVWLTPWLAHYVLQSGKKRKWMQTYFYCWRKIANLVYTYKAWHAVKNKISSAFVHTNCTIPNWTQMRFLLKFFYNSKAYQKHTHNDPTDSVQHFIFPFAWSTFSTRQSLCSNVNKQQISCRNACSVYWRSIRSMPTITWIIRHGTECEPTI